MKDSDTISGICRPELLINSPRWLGISARAVSARRRGGSGESSRWLFILSSDLNLFKLSPPSPSPGQSIIASFLQHPLIIAALFFNFFFTTPRSVLNIKQCWFNCQHIYHIIFFCGPRNSSTFTCTHPLLLKAYYILQMLNFEIAKNFSLGSKLKTTIMSFFINKMDT
jgi:hypothetical protein